MIFTVFQYLSWYGIVSIITTIAEGLLIDKEEIEAITAGQLNRNLIHRPVKDEKEDIKMERS